MLWRLCHNFVLKAETVENETVFGNIPNLSNKCKTEAKADVDNYEQNFCHKYG